ncbi:hypothetical protein CMQ_6576 [Grosmannia clavigera kw1407]|uniref:Uncharacterized protein n=1 Tax=Grosmannia clavigera (strain kw1407 / UAMH 11150) TaxID=655863 RepID=F0X6Q2_GROCL|nr:uncharacterized protein CMQ_6576 [Grosmannia clavigera kw1407]EFX06255.1 hypothetical protein CMQ_6576 [Grosmannia clavigera kw1407]
MVLLFPFRLVVGQQVTTFLVLLVTSFVLINVLMRSMSASSTQPGPFQSQGPRPRLDDSSTKLLSAVFPHLDNGAGRCVGGNARFDRLVIGSGDAFSDG